jgi:TetR/AcrR family acrAB operon transcriptional repressor
MREKLLAALREAAARLSSRLPTESDVAFAAGVKEAVVRKHLGPPENYSALLSFQGQTQDTRERIIASAARVFGQKGFQRASLDQVASDAGLTKGAIYWHFKSKNDLYFALLDSRFQRDVSAMRESLAAMLSTASPPDTARLMATIFSASLSAATTDPDWPRLFVEVMGHSREPEVRERIGQFYDQGWDFARRMVADLQSAGLIRQDIDPDMMATFWFALGDGLVLAWLTQPERIDFATLAQGILDMMWRGIAPTDDNKNTGAASA